MFQLIIHNLHPFCLETAQVFQEYFQNYSEFLLKTNAFDHNFSEFPENY